MRKHQGRVHTHGKPIQILQKKSDLIEIQYFKDIEDSVLKAGITPDFLGFQE